MVVSLLLPCHSVFLTSEGNTALRFIWNLITTPSSHHLIFCFSPSVFEAGLQNGNAANRLLLTTWELQPAFSLYSLTSTAPLAGKAILQTTFQTKMLLKLFITRSVPVPTSYVTYNFQLMPSFSQRLHIQMAGLEFSAFLTFFLLFLPSHPISFGGPDITDPTLWKQYSYELT